MWKPFELFKAAGDDLVDDFGAIYEFETVIDRRKNLLDLVY